MDQLQDLIVKLTQLLDWLWPFAHPKEVVLGMLNDSIGLSFGAYYPWRTTVLTALLMGLMVVQFALAVIGFLGVPAVGGLHGINALVMVGLGGWLTWKNWAFGRRAPATPVAIRHAEAP